MSESRLRVLRGVFGFFAVYLGVMTLAMLSPATFNQVMGLVGLRWPRVPSREHVLLANMALCGLVPTAYLAARTAIYGEWTAVNRGFFLVMLAANLVANLWSIGRDASFVTVLAGDFAIVLVLLGIAVATPPDPARSRSSARR